jgi:ferredoxin
MHKEGTMKQILRVSILLVLLFIAFIQITSAKGIFFNKAKQEVCPVNAIYMENGKAKIDSIKCIGCGRCVDGFLAIPDDILPLDTTPGLNEAPKSLEDTLSSQIETPSQEDTMKPSRTSPLPSDVKGDHEMIEKQEQKESVADSARIFNIVDPDKCISCGLCINACPEDAISYVDGKAYIDSLKCINCGICIGAEPGKFKGCPVDAIYSSGHK